MMMQRRLWEDEHADTVAVLGAELAASDAALGLINLPTLTKKEETRWMVPSSSSGDADMAAVGGEKMAAYSAAAAKILRRRQVSIPCCKFEKPYSQQAELAGSPTPPLPRNPPEHYA
ncbi:uncharacterized protein LOC131149146 isoform X6 [Malania oleifera]|uniref:uncharacterized protein LOC131149146 isoform X6 n=1 Tax=Malania oleifera TaxID=397392 RepID=UPI0025AE984A|nr:uncharacterized protein LOC131149146 isoform X6 [Malania oleifera]